MLKRLLVVVVGLFGLVSLTYGQVEIIDSGKKEVEADFRGNKLTRTDRTISVKNQGPVNYGFRYSYYDPFTRGEKITKTLPKWVGFPHIGDATTSTTGLGLTGGAWYSMCAVFKSMETGGWVNLPLKEEVVPPQYKPYYKKS